MTRYVLTPLAVGIVLKLKLAKFLLWAAACKLAVLGASAVLTVPQFRWRARRTRRTCRCSEAYG